MTIRFDKIMLLLFFILFLGILPAAGLLGFVLPLQYMLIPIFMFVFLFIIFGWVKVPRFAKFIISLWLLIVIEVIFSGVFSPMLKLGTFNLPTESVQYIARMLYCIIFIAIFYNYEINHAKFMRMFLVILLLGMCVAVVQFFNFGAISSLFQNLYSYSDHHLNYMLRSNLWTKRVTGVAYHATANGGIAAFTFIILMSMFIYFKKRRLFTSVGLILILINVVASQARMGYLTLAFSIVVFYWVYNYIYKKSIKSTIFFTSIVTAISFTIYFLYQRGNDFILRAAMRWEGLTEQVSEGGNRYGQVLDALDKLVHPWDYLFGISRGVEVTFPSFFIEVEPINIFVLYGAFGFILQYSLVIILLVYFFKNMRVLKQYPILLTMVVASFISLISYQFFSGAYFFFREIYVGLFPWILMGATIGAVERFKRYPEKFVKKQGIVNVEEKKPSKRYRIVW